jgi:hypothetical protein
MGGGWTRIRRRRSRRHGRPSKGGRLELQPGGPDRGELPALAPPGKPSVADILAGNTNAPSIELRVFDFDTGVFAGVESLIRRPVSRAGVPTGQSHGVDAVSPAGALSGLPPLRRVERKARWALGQGQGPRRSAAHPPPRTAFGAAHYLAAAEKRAVTEPPGPSVAGGCSAVGRTVVRPQKKTTVRSPVIGELAAAGSA